MEKLQRQRALLHDHLRWLESEIATEAAAVQAGGAEPAIAPIAVVPEAEAPVETPAGTLADDVLEPNVLGIHSEVRSGCLLYFAIACAAAALLVAFVYWRY